MNVDRKRIYVHFEHSGKRYSIVCEVDNPSSQFPVYIAWGEEFKNPVESLTAYGCTAGEAVIQFVKEMGRPLEKLNNSMHLTYTTT